MSKTAHGEKMPKTLAEFEQELGQLTSDEPDERPWSVYDFQHVHEEHVLRLVEVLNAVRDARRRKT